METNHKDSKVGSGGRHCRQEREDVLSVNLPHSGEFLCPTPVGPGGNGGEYLLAVPGEWRGWRGWLGIPGGHSGVSTGFLGFYKLSFVGLWDLRGFLHSTPDLHDPFGTTRFFLVFGFWFF